MTTVAPHTMSAISGGAFRHWHYAHTETERHQLIRDMLGQERGHVLFYAWDRPAGGKADQYPGHQLKIVYNGRVGAAHFTNGDPEHGPVGAWLTQADQPPADPSEVIYDPWDPDRVSLPADALLSLERLREIAEEYATTGQRPTAAQWTSVPWV